MVYGLANYKSRGFYYLVHTEFVERMKRMNREYLMNWSKKAGIRAVKTVAQTAVGMIGTSVLIVEVNWVAVVYASILAGILSLLTSIAGLPELKE